MSQPTVFHQLGRFIFLFQHVESALTELLVQMAYAEDEEVVRILVNELEFSKRVRTTHVMFARFVELERTNMADVSAVAEFHELMDQILRLAERRNKIVHSNYMVWTTVDGEHGLIRQSSTLKTSKSKVARDLHEEELLPSAIESDGDKVAVVLQALESFRQKVIDWSSPDVS